VVDFPADFPQNRGMKTKEFPKTVRVSGIPGLEATIYRRKQTKSWAGEDGKIREKKYDSYTLIYPLLGQMHREWFSDLDKAVTAGEEAIKKIAGNEQRVLELKNSDRDIYLRAKDALPPGIELDVAATIIADCLKALAGKGNPVEACREFAKRHGGTASKAMVLDAVKEMITEEEKQQDGKRRVAWVKLLKTHLENKFGADFNKRVDQVEPSEINTWITKLECAERTKKNIRDCLKHFFKWCRVRGYLPKDADPLADVQDFRKRKRGKIHILTPEELSKLMSKADDDLVAYLALRAFAGLRDSEARQIDWGHIDLKSGWIEITEEVAKASDDDDGCRRMVPIRDCLKAWLSDYVKNSGRVCRFENTAKQLAALCEDAGVTWHRNALRHSQISYAVAESGDIPAVAIHSGNSPAVIKQSYWNPRVTPDKAKAWFSVLPGESVPSEKVTNLPQAAAK
jgi:integrase